MSLEINTAVSPSFHPENVKNIDGYNETSAPYLGPAEELMQDTYNTLGKLHEARKVASKNPTWNEQQQILHVSDTAYSQQQRLAKRFDSTVATMDKQIKSMDEMLTSPLKQKAGTGNLNTEIRKHVADMDINGRHKFLRQAIDKNDVTTLTALLGAPAYLSGMSDTEHSIYTRQYHEMVSPDTAQRLKALRNAKDYLEKRGSALLLEVEKAMGSNWRQVASIREAHSKATQALNL